MLGQRLDGAHGAGGAACRTSWSSCVRVSDSVRRSPPGPVLVDVQATQSASHRDRGVARYTAELAARALAAPSGARAQLLAQPRSRAAGLGRAARRERPARLQRSRRRRRRAGCCTSARRSSSTSRSAGCGRRAAASRGMRLVGDALRPDPRDLRRALPRRSRSAPPLPRPARARARGRPGARDLRDHRARRGRAAARCPRTECVVVVRRGRGGFVRAARLAADALRAARGRGPGLEERFVLYTGGHGRPEELPRPVPRVGPPAARRCATAGSS